MGVFSWNDCTVKGRGKRKTIMLGTGPVYVLIPKEFGGGHIIEHYYDGYGDFGGHDIYDLVADWNKGLYHDFSKFQTPTPKEDFFGFYDFEKEEMLQKGMTEQEIKDAEEKEIQEKYEKNLKYYQLEKAVFEDFMNGLTDAELSEKYSGYEKREIGIAIACDTNNFKLKYPIKITYDKDAVYEDCRASSMAANQGCY